MNVGATLGPLDLIGAVLYWPPFSFVIALTIAGVIAVVASRNARTPSRRSGLASSLVPARFIAEHRVIGVVAIMIAMAFLVEFVLHGYVLTGPEVWWWRFALPIACAVIGIGVIFSLIATRGTTPPEVPVLPATRRTWLSFSSPSSLLIAAIVLLTLIATTVAAGMASSPSDEGQYVWLVMPIPNEADIDPLRLHFYGWTYGLPVLVSLVALISVAWAALNRNASRPFLRPETVTVERGARRITASGVTLLLTAATLLSLAGAWRLIARGGSGQRLRIEGQNEGLYYDASWRFGDLAIAAGWTAPLVEIVAFSILILLAVNRLRRTLPTPARSSAPTSPAAAIGAQR